MQANPATSRLAEIENGAVKLANSIEFAKEKSFFYKRLLRKVLREPMSPDAVLEKFGSLPFTSKEDVIRNYPSGFLCVEANRIALYCESSGTSGNTVGSTKSASYFTAEDLNLDTGRRFSPDLRPTSNDVIANTLPFALTSSGIGFFMAAKAAGTAVVNLDAGSVLSSPRKHLDVMGALNVSILVCSQPFLYSTMVMLDGQDIRSLLPSLRAVQLCGLATLPNAKRKIQRIFGVPIFDTYGLSEFGATTHTCRDGHMHVYEEDFLVEIIDPRTGTPHPPGTGGEIVVTTLTRQASPKLRYRTGDFGIMGFGRCSCGRDFPRLTVKGRLRDAAQFGSRFRLPIDFEEVIHEFDEPTGLYRLHYVPDASSSPREVGAANVVRARVVVDSTDLSASLQSRMEARMTEEFGPVVSVELVAPGKSTRGLFDDALYSSVRTIKSATFADERPTEWLVTY
jgi:phenylacetate-CoA ligase